MESSQSAGSLISRLSYLVKPAPFIASHGRFILRQEL